MTFTEIIINAIKSYANDLTQNWIVENSTENSLGVSFDLETDKYIGSVSVCDLPGTLNAVVVSELGKSVIFKDQFVPFLNSLNNTKVQGHRAPQDCVMPQEPEMKTSPKKFNHIF